MYGKTYEIRWDASTTPGCCDTLWKMGDWIFGPIEPTSQGKSYILVCTNYVTKWVEAETLKNLWDNNLSKLSYAWISTWFGVPRKLVFTQGPQFTLHLITTLMEEYKIRHGKWSPYYPQDNG